MTSFLRCDFRTIFALAISSLTIDSLHGQEASLQTVISDWKARQSFIRSYRASLVEMDFDPEVDKEPFRNEWEFLIMAPKVLSTYKGRRLRINRDGSFATLRIEERIAFNGRDKRSLKLTDDGSYPRGTIIKTKMTETGGTFAALSAWLCPFDSELGEYDPAKLRMFGRATSIEGVSCACIQKSNSPLSVFRCWVDPSRKSIPIRIAELVDGKTIYQCDIRYSADSEFGWVLAGWVSQSYRSDLTLRTSRRFTVSKWKINGPVADDEFNIVFPNETRVQDQTTADWSIANESGEMRPIDDTSELTAKPESIRFGVWSWLTLLLFCVGCGLAVKYWNRRRAV